MSEVTLRLFVGVRLPERLKPAFGVYVKKLQSAPGLADVRWTAIANLHITLKFIGDVARGKIRELAHEINAISGDLALCNQGHGSIAFDRVIALPIRGPRVLALDPDAHGVRVLQSDHALIEEACLKAGIPPEGRAFKPHMTLGRFRHPPRALDLNALPRPPSERFAEPEELFASELAPDGAVYTPLFRVFDDPGRLRI